MTTTVNKVSEYGEIAPIAMKLFDYWGETLSYYIFNDEPIAVDLAHYNPHGTHDGRVFDIAAYMIRGHLLRGTSVESAIYKHALNEIETHVLRVLHGRWGSDKGLWAMTLITNLTDKRLVEIVKTLIFIEDQSHGS